MRMYFDYAEKEISSNVEKGILLYTQLEIIIFLFDLTVGDVVANSCY